MELTTVVPIIAIAAGLFGIIAKQRLEIWSKKKDARFNSAANFRASFNRVVTIAKTNKINDLKIFLGSKVLPESKTSIQ